MHVDKYALSASYIPGTVLGTGKVLLKTKGLMYLIPCTCYPGFHENKGKLSYRSYFQGILISNEHII
jgi:hypothetical protein